MNQFYVEIIMFIDGSNRITGDEYELKGYLPLLAENEKDAVEIAEATIQEPKEGEVYRLFVGKAHLAPISKKDWNYYSR